MWAAYRGTPAWTRIWSFLTAYFSNYVAWVWELDGGSYLSVLLSCYTSSFCSSHYGSGLNSLYSGSQVQKIQRLPAPKIISGQDKDNILLSLSIKTHTQLGVFVSADLLWLLAQFINEVSKRHKTRPHIRAFLLPSGLANQVVLCPCL